MTAEEAKKELVEMHILEYQEFIMNNNLDANKRCEAILLAIGALSLFGKKDRDVQNLEEE